MKKCIHVIFKGDVQGVGFRFTARQIADKYNVAGWVYNSPDGSVEIEVEGELNPVNDFLIELKSEFHEGIESFESKEINYTGQHKDFKIRF
jgi:acylphosphatase